MTVNCGRCFFSTPDKRNLGTVICHGAPATAFNIQNDGTIGLKSSIGTAQVYPAFNVSDPPCALWRCRVCHAPLFDSANKIHDELICGSAAAC